MILNGLSSMMAVRTILQRLSKLLNKLIYVVLFFLCFSVIPIGVYGEESDKWNQLIEEAQQSKQPLEEKWTESMNQKVLDAYHIKIWLVEYEEKAKNH